MSSPRGPSRYARGCSGPIHHIAYLVYVQEVDRSRDPGEIVLFSFFFFFQAEDGIRDSSVTGVQTCALPIFGPQALMYLLVSFFFSVGLHPLGARWIQEHYLVLPTQETYSYYGPLNTIAFNVGYHNVHHALPSIPSNHLPAVMQAAPELYNSLVFLTSWTILLFRFLFDSNI